MAEMEKSGISLHANHVPKSLKRDEGGKLIFEAENGKTLVVDRLIWAIGRGPNVDMGLENTDIVLNDKGYIKADEFENTSVDGVYAIGDAANYPGKVELIATGYGEAPVAINQAINYIYPDRDNRVVHSTSLIK